MGSPHQPNHLFNQTADAHSLFFVLSRINCCNAILKLLWLLVLTLLCQPRRLPLNGKNHLTKIRHGDKPRKHQQSLEQQNNSAYLSQTCSLYTTNYSDTNDAVCLGNPPALWQKSRPDSMPMYLRERVQDRPDPLLNSTQLYSFF